MKTDFKNYKGVIVCMVGDTQNTLPYSNNEELFELVEKTLKINIVDIYDFEEKFVYSIFNKSDLHRLKKELI